MEINRFADDVHQEIANNPQLWFSDEEEEYNVSLCIYIYIDV